MHVLCYTRALFDVDIHNCTVLFDGICVLFQQDEVPAKFRLPLPMVTIFTCGKASPSKVNFIKEYIVVPSPLMQPELVSMRNVFAFDANRNFAH